jgi:tetratricopeptide (TPR) repeat protein
VKGLSLLYLRRYGEAAEWFRRTLDMNPRNPRAGLFLAQAYALQNQFEEAMAAAEQAIRVKGRLPRTLSGLATVHALAGRVEESRRVLTELRLLAQTAYVPASLFAKTYAQIDEKEEAFEWVEKALDQRDPLLLFIKVDPSFDSLRSDQRYPGLLKKMNLA